MNQLIRNKPFEGRKRTIFVPPSTLIGDSIVAQAALSPVVGQSTVVNKVSAPFPSTISTSSADSRVAVYLSWNLVADEFNAI